MPELELMILRKHAGLSGERYYDSNSNLFRGLGKDSITNQSAISLIIRTTGVCWNQMVCKRMARNKGVLLKRYNY